MNEPYVLVKNGMFFRTGRAGYTSSIYEAGQFSKDDALLTQASVEGVKAHPIGKFLDKPTKVKFEEPVLTPTDVAEYRDLTGATMSEATQELRRRGRQKAFADFRRRANTRDKVEFILDWIEAREG